MSEHLWRPTLWSVRSRRGRRPSTSCTFTAVAGFAALVAVLFAANASAKDFDPGDVRICGSKRCVAIGDGDALRALSSFLYGRRRPEKVRRPRSGTAAFELRFKDGSAAGLVASADLDRMLVYGVDCGRFVRGRWYRLPTRASLELRTLTASLRPLRMTLNVPRSC